MAARTNPGFHDFFAEAWPEAYRLGCFFTQDPALGEESRPVGEGEALVGEVRFHVTRVGPGAASIVIEAFAVEANELVTRLRVPVLDAP